MAADVDTGYIAAHLSIDKADVATLLDAPTSELVRAFLQSVQTKATAFEHLASGKLRAEVELETVVRLADTRNRTSKETIEKHVKEIETLREKLSQEENARGAVEQELRDLRSTSAGQRSEIESLLSRNAALEISKREAFALAEAQSAAHAKASEELAAQQQKVTSLRSELNNLEEQKSVAESAVVRAKFRQQILDGEIDSLKKNNSWLEEENTKLKNELTKVKKEKIARVAELQNLYNDAAESVENLRRIEVTLRNRIEDLTTRVQTLVDEKQKIQDEALITEQALRSELEGFRRACELQEDSAKTAKSQVEELQKGMEQMRKDATLEIAQLMSDVDDEHAQKLAAQDQVIELERQLEQLRAEMPRRNRSIPATPRRGNGHGTPSRSALRRPESPAVAQSPGGSRLAGSTMSPARLNEISTVIQYEQVRGERMEAAVDELIKEVERRRPELEDLRIKVASLRTENDRLQEDAQAARAERDKVKREASKWEGEAHGISLEADMVRQQLGDVGVQIRILLVELEARAQGLDPLEPNNQAALLRAIQQEVGDDVLRGVSEGNKYISQRLLIYRNVKELQEQNEQLIAAARKLVNDMDTEQARRERNQYQQDQQEIKDLKDQLASQKAETEAVSRQLQHCQNERSMFRELYARRGGIVDDVSSPSDPHIAVNDLAVQAQETQDKNPETAVIPEHAANLITTLTSTIESLQKHSATEKETIETLAKENRELQVEVHRESLKLESANERYELLRGAFDSLQAEHNELQKQHASLEVLLSQQNSLVEKSTTELVEAQASIDSLRTELVDVKTAHGIAKNTQTRLEDEIMSRIDEQSKLTLQLAQQKRMFEELEQNSRVMTEKNAEIMKQRDVAIEASQSRIKALEESVSHLNLLRENDFEKNRERNDDLRNGLIAAREELIRAQMERDQLQTRVNELQTELQQAKEKAESRQPRLLPETPVQTQLKAEIAELEEIASDFQHKLELKQIDLDEEKALHDITRRAEARYNQAYTAVQSQLNELNEQYEVYRRDTDDLLAEKDTTIADLEARVEQLSTELDKVNGNLSELRTAQEETERIHNEQKGELEFEAKRLQDECERLEETVGFLREDLKMQADIAQQAQHNYEDELIKHSEAAKNLHKVRSDYNEVNAKVLKYRSDAETAQEILEQSQERWAEQRQMFEKEMLELRLSRGQLQEQNEVLHRQLEEFNSQIAELQKTRELLLTGPAPNIDPTKAAANYQEIIRQLRKDKEILDAQLFAAQSECRQLQGRYDVAKQQAAEARDRLSFELNNKIEDERVKMTAKQANDTLNSLHIVKESNALLRVEATRAQEKVTNLENVVEELRAALEPLKERIVVLEVELEMKDKEVGIVEQDRDFWRKRSDDLVTKHHRIDPKAHEDLKAQLKAVEAERDQLLALRTDLEALKAQLTALETERDQLLSQRAELETLKTQFTVLEAERDDLVAQRNLMQEKIDAIPQLIQDARDELNKDFQERRNKLIEQSKAKAREQGQVIREQKIQLDSMSEQLSAAKEEVEMAKAERDEAVANARLQAPTTDDANDGQSQGGIPPASVDQTSDIETKLAAAEERAIAEATKATQAQTEVQVLQERVHALEAEITELRRQVGEKSNELTGLQRVLSEGNVSANESLAQLQAELSGARQELDVLRASAAVSVSGGTAADEEGARSVTEQINEQVEVIRKALQEEQEAARKKLQEEHAAAIKAHEETFQRRADTMKKQLSTKLQEGKVKVHQELLQEFDQAMKNAEKEHAGELDRLKAEHAAEKKGLEETIKKLQDDSDKSAGAPSDAQASSTQGNAPTTPQKLNLTSDQIKELLNTNPTLKDILTRNITKKVAEAQERAKDEQAKAVAQAVEMANKRNGVKLNFLETKARAATAKIEVVETAAKETPQRPVGEVWAIAKDAKAPEKPARPPAPQLMPAVAKPPSSGPVEPPAAHTEQGPAASVPVVASSLGDSSQPAGLPKKPPASQVAPAFAQGQADTHATGKTAAPASTFLTNPFAIQQAAPGTQQPNPQAGRGQLAPMGTGPNAVRSVSAQGPPQPGLPRGGASSIPRGGGRGAGRGGFQAQQQPLPGQQFAQGNRGGSNIARPGGGGRGGRGGGQPRGAASPGGGRGGQGGQQQQMNPGARPFAPAGKRPAEDSPDGKGPEKKQKSDGSGSQ